MSSKYLGNETDDEDDKSMYNKTNAPTDKRYIVSEDDFDTNAKQKVRTVRAMLIDSQVPKTAQFHGLLTDNQQTNNDINVRFGHEKSGAVRHLFDSRTGEKLTEEWAHQIAVFEDNGTFYALKERGARHSEEIIDVDDRSDVERAKDAYVNEECSFILNLENELENALSN